MNDTSIACRNGGRHHTHHSLEESRACYGLAPASPALASVSRPEPGPSALAVPSWTLRPVSERQLWKLEQLGGSACAKAARYLTRGQASAVIDELLHPEKEVKVTQPDPTPAPAPYTPAPTPAARPVDPRHAMIAGLLTMVPDGYYAVHEHEGGHVDFIRISRPKKNRYAGSIKVQTVMGSWGNVRLKAEPDAALWPSGTLSVYDRSGHTEDKLLLLVADYNGARRRYAQKIGNCCRCNASLTDDKSRHYGIGPECVKHWPEIVEQVDMEDAIAAAEASI
jgi:hypothetical protein